MTFRYPWMLILLLLAPAAVYLRYHMRRSAAVRFSENELIEHLPASWAVRLRFLLPLLYGLGLACLITAAARPQRGLQEREVHAEVVDIVLLVDVSTSMRAIDFSTATREINRLDAAKDVIRDFIRGRRTDRIGVVAFSALPYTVAPLTLDHDWLIRQMNRLKTGMLEDGTAIGSAIASAVNRLRDSEAVSKVVVLLTDGVNNAGAVSPENAAQAAKALGIKIYTIGAGSRGMARYPVQDPFGGRHYVRQPVEIDEATLKRIAEITGAAYFRATDMDRLAEIYEAIDEMEKTEIDIEQFTRYEEVFAGFAGWALGLLLLERLLAAGRLGRLPS